MEKGWRKFSPPSFPDYQPNYFFFFLSPFFLAKRANSFRISLASLVCPFPFDSKSANFFLFFTAAASVITQIAPFFCLYFFNIFYLDFFFELFPGLLLLNRTNSLRILFNLFCSPGVLSFLLFKQSSSLFRATRSGTFFTTSHLLSSLIQK